MIKVFTSVFVLERTANALDAIEETLVLKPVPAEMGRRHAMELHVEVKAPRSRTDRNA